MNVKNHNMNEQIRRTPKDLATMVGGVTEISTIEMATHAYFEELDAFAFPATIPLNEALHQGFKANLQAAEPLVKRIMREINERAQVLSSANYRMLVSQDTALWNSNGANIKGGELACVDKGVPKEASGLEDAVGRTFAGDTTITFSPIRNKFIPFVTPTTKRMVHMIRSGLRIPELLTEHTACGRRNQILSNETGHPDIPSMDLIIKHLDALRSEFPDADDVITTNFESIRNLWNGYTREGVAVKTPDGGAWIGIMGKIAQRQALRELSTDIIPSIKLYDKHNGNIFVGLDTLTALTHPVVLKEGGYTDTALETLAQEGVIFSFKNFTKHVEEEIVRKTTIQKGSKTFEDLQTDWLVTRKTLVEIVKALWNLYDHDDEVIVTMTNDYCEKMFSTLDGSAKPNGDIKRWFIHQLFHSYSYAYLLNTLERGNPPGEHHVENHLAVGDHEVGTKSNLALGQGDVENPATSEIFTGYTVLLHSKPGKDDAPVIVMIKLDTDRKTHQPLSTEETKIALESFKTFLNLWPYFLVGDMIPVVAVRGKEHGGVDRLALSIVLPFLDIPTLLTQEKNSLPLFVYALNSKGEVVYMPAKDVIEVGEKTKGDLHKFRQELPKVADIYSRPEIQESFIQSMKK